MGGFFVQFIGLGKEVLRRRAPNQEIVNESNERHFFCARDDQMKRRITVTVRMHQFCYGFTGGRTKNNLPK